MSGARMDNPCMVVDGALTALLNVGETITNIGVDETLLELTHLRSSQINECSVCVDLAFKGLTKLGVAADKMVAVSAWRQSTLFDDKSGPCSQLQRNSRVWLTARRG